MQFLLSLTSSQYTHPGAERSAEFLATDRQTSLVADAVYEVSVTSPCLH